MLEHTAWWFFAVVGGLAAVGGIAVFFMDRHLSKMRKIRAKKERTFILRVPQD